MGRSNAGFRNNTNPIFIVWILNFVAARQTPTARGCRLVSGTRAETFGRTPLFVRSTPKGGQLTVPCSTDDKRSREIHHLRDARENIMSNDLEKERAFIHQHEASGVPARPHKNRDAYRKWIRARWWRRGWVYARMVDEFTGVAEMQMTFPDTDVGREMREIFKRGLKMQWIKCSDRLPQINYEDGQPRPSDNILINDPKWGILIGYLTGYGEWQDNHGTACGCCSEDIHPTHWMELPKPPECKETQ